MNLILVPQSQAEAAYRGGGGEEGGVAHEVETVISFCSFREVDE